MTSRVILLIFTSVFIFSACTGIQKKKPNAPEPDLPFKPVKIAEHSKHPGFSIYMKTCHQCHQQADPTTLSVEKWQNKVPTMAKHAGISKEDGEKVLNYILHVKSEGLR